MSIYVAGKKLTLERFVLQKLSGSWQNCSKYEKNAKHRFRMKFKNSYGTGTPVGGSSYGTSDIHVADLRVKLQLPGAKFDGDGNETTVAALMPMMIKGHPDFNDTIAPMTTRWFDVGAFTWTAASASISSVLVQVYTFHREITHIPPAPTANLVASSS